MSLWAKFSLDGGRAWSEDRLVYAAPDGPICQCCAPSVAFAPDGRIGILWRNLVQGARDLYATETTDGLHFSPARKLGQGTWMLNGCPMDGGSWPMTPPAAGYRSGSGSERSSRATMPRRSARSPMGPLNPWRPSSGRPR